MKTLRLVSLLLTMVATTAIAQRGADQRGGDQRGPEQRGPAQQHRANGGHIPPAPASRARGAVKAEVETFPGGKVDARPHVSNDHWYGHDDADDARYHLTAPYAHGRFPKIGPTFQYRVVRSDLPHHRFWVSSGLGFEVAAWDWPFAAGWCWSCADDLVVYDDPDHVGWYLVYNTETGLYVHAQYIGS
jgi:hypothetical protein